MWWKMEKVDGMDVRKSKKPRKKYKVVGIKGVAGRYARFFLPVSDEEEGDVVRRKARDEERGVSTKMPAVCAIILLKERLCAVHSNMTSCGDVDVAGTKRCVLIFSAWMIL